MAENEEMKNNELSEQDMQDVTGGGLHLKDGRLIVSPAYHCNNFKGDGGHFGMCDCTHCDYEVGVGLRMVCNHPSNRR